MGLTLRLEKGESLTYQEFDDNFTYLKNFANSLAGIGGQSFSFDNFAYIEDRKDAGTNGGTASSGAWRTRDLNSLIINNIDGLTLENNQVTFPAGKFWIEAIAPFYRVDRSCIRLYDIIDAEVLIQGRTDYGSNNSSYSGQYSRLKGIIENDSEFTTQIQYRCDDNNSNNGLGVNSGNISSYVEHEVFTMMQIWKIGA